MDWGSRGAPGSKVATDLFTALAMAPGMRVRVRAGVRVRVRVSKRKFVDMLVKVLCERGDVCE